MRRRKNAQGLTVNAIAGSHVVTLGIDLAPSKRTGCLGFAIKRTDHTEGESYWMSGTKTFKETDPGIGPGGQVSSHDHPFQSFQWADYSAKPGYDYTYKVIPMYGSPSSLQDGDGLEVRIQTETEFGQLHSIFFNRGAVASQEYARRFQNKRPDDPSLGQAAYKWLQRGLLDALAAFIAQATDSKWEIHGAIYEFQWHDALLIFKDAKARGVKVRLVYDEIPGGPGPLNDAAIADAQIKAICSPRTNGKIMHNKFFVLSKNGKPQSVWLGSTNLTENGIFGHLNCGHVIEDPDVAASYLGYWSELKSDPAIPDEKDWIAENNPAPPDPWNEKLTPIFSPRRGLDVLDWYAQIANSARKGLFMTFAFGMHKNFKDVYEQEDGVLRFALMEKEGNGAGLAQGKIDIARIRRLSNVVVAIGKNIQLNSFDRWLKERAKLTQEANIKYVHTKFMLVDPLSDSPTTITGSANFSGASTDTNDENMVVIKGDKRVADIYLGEFMRTFSHYAFREAVANWEQWHPNEEWTPNHLIKNDSWLADYFKAGNPRSLRREYFA
ncbi:MAG: hypothetical protein K1Y02_25710 [Candidatus Hydrogenedentes bacterium]|nr:hypothetical protein [Candidatus Hydrogenedentota bacterium]